MAQPSKVPLKSERDRPRRSAALLIVDMINRFDFEGAERLLPAAQAATAAILSLRKQADRLGVPAIYVNDNFGEWHADPTTLISSALDRLPSPELKPRQCDYFIIKPQFSGFYSTNLAVLLPKLGVRDLVLTGVATDICVLFTAADAHMRDYRLWVPRDAVAAEDEARGDAALEIMRSHMGAEIEAARDLRLEDWIAAGR